MPEWMELQNVRLIRVKLTGSKSEFYLNEIVPCPNQVV